ncbi:MAG: hypothetical protein KatS3mg025_0929 [Bacteroidia bacterium]|jgi:serine phosphatase RsbU (regulator of sigma subunit)|nr:MAG: hypothetical protein KatS3mg025_0929 [Bacteroidia bacterium]
MQGLDFPRLCATESVARSAELIADAWEKGGAVSTELVLRTAAGEKIPVEVSTRVVEVEKQPAIILYVRDIRERLRLLRIIEEKNQQLIESIQYARRLQVAALPSLVQMQALFPHSFLLYLPRDIVSGDFYWIAQKGSKRFLAVGDCTGHGVPGAMMVMLSLAFLNQALYDVAEPTPGRLLTYLHQGLCSVFTTEGIRDGADVIMLMQEGESLTWTSANRPLWWFAREEGFQELKGDRAPLGGSTDKDYVWSDRDIPLQSTARLFLATDGYADQFGGPERRKLTTGRFKRLLAETALLPLAEQEKALRTFFHSWQGEMEQIDDILVVGVEVGTT